MVTKRGRKSSRSHRGVATDVVEPSAKARILQQLTEHPYAALGLALGLGFVVGRGPATRASGRVMAAGMRAAVPVLLAPVAAALVEIVSALGSSGRRQSTLKEKRT